MVHALNAVVATDDDEVSARAAAVATADAAEHTRRPLRGYDRVGWLAVIWRPVFDAHCRCPCLSCVRHERVCIIIYYNKKKKIILYARRQTTTVVALLRSTIIRNKFRQLKRFRFSSFIVVVHFRHSSSGTIRGLKIARTASPGQSPDGNT